MILGSWFEPGDHIEGVTAIEHGRDVGDVHRVGYRFDVTNNDGRRAVEQQAYYRVAGATLTYLRIVCSGFRPRDGAAS